MLEALEARGLRATIALGTAAARLTAEARGGEHGRCLLPGLHPWLVGQPHRIRYLEDQRLAALRQAPHLSHPAR